MPDPPNPEGALATSRTPGQGLGGEMLRGWWRSWYGKEEFRLTLPEGWRLIDARMRNARTLSDAQIQEQLRQPIGSAPLRDLARGRRDACVAIDDLTRPTETFRILPEVLDELRAAGLRDEQLCVLVSLGTHRPLTRSDLLKKVGDRVLRAVRVYNHNPYLNLARVGTTSFGTPVLINATPARRSTNGATGTRSTGKCSSTGRSIFFRRISARPICSIIIPLKSRSCPTGPRCGKSCKNGTEVRRPWPSFRAARCSLARRLTPGLP